MKRLLIGALVSLAVAGLSSSACADEPLGFATFPWGTDREEVVRVVAEKCRGMMDKGATISVLCLEYPLEGISRPAILTLEFVEQKLQGYAISVSTIDGPSFRTALVEKFGKPVASNDAGMTWSWRSGTSAVFILTGVPPAHSMLMVTTKTASDRSAADSKREREKIKKGF